MSLIYTVSKGDCLSKIAKKFGFAKWQTIYNHPDNAAFRTKRPNPNIICAGDKLAIPEREKREVDCRTDQKHQFVLKKQKTLLTLFVQDASGRALEGKDYKLEVEGRDEPYTGTTGGKGLIEVVIDAEASEGTLTVFACGGGYTWPLDIGDLDPIDEDSGAIDRLQNLAYDIDDEPPADDLAALLKAFQHEHGLKVTGALDDDTRDKLESLHDDSQPESEAVA